MHTDLMREDFSRWEDFDKSARVANHSEFGVIELMPVSDDHRYAFKYVNGHPRNTGLGLSTVIALAAQSLARRDSRVMALIGNGAQSDVHA